MGIELNISAFPRTNNLGNPTLAQKIEKDPQEYYFVKGSPEKFESVEEAVNGVNPPADGFVTLYHHVPKHDSRDAWRHAGEGALIGLAVGTLALTFISAGLTVSLGLRTALTLTGGVVGSAALLGAAGCGVHRYNHDHDDFTARVWNTLPPWER